MEEIVDDDNIDSEELQAQIDLALANTRNLVASWVDSSYSASTSKQSLIDQEKEIEELLRRPPRLGVGASVSVATGSSGQQAAKLKGKLAGKKHFREDETNVVVSQSDEEEESRGGAIKKKPRIDPFAQSKGKRKTRAETETKTLNPSTSAASAQKVDEDKDTQEKTKSSDQKEKTSARPAAMEPALFPRLKPTETTGSKKKKKNKTTTSSAIPSAPSAKTRSRSPEVVEVIVIKDTPPSSPKPKYTPSNLTSAVPPVEKTNVPGSAEASAPTSNALLGMPLLNLDGPPPTPEPGTPGKKRRKRKKKKRPDQANQGPTGGEPMDVDADIQEDPMKRTDDGDEND